MKELRLGEMSGKSRITGLVSGSDGSRISLSCPTAVAFPEPHYDLKHGECPVPSTVRGDPGPNRGSIGHGAPSEAKETSRGVRDF